MINTVFEHIYFDHSCRRHSILYFFMEEEICIFLSYSSSNILNVFLAALHAS
jgi:hypothetical protein